MGTVRTSTVADLLTLDDVKEHLRVDDNREDAYIRRLIRAAQEYAEVAQRQQVSVATYSETFDRFPASAFFLEAAPLVSVQSVGYRDTNGSSAVVSSTAYTVDATVLPGRIAENDGDSWPSTQPILNAVTIAYTAGYSTAASVGRQNTPERTKVAVLLLVGHWYKHREAVVAESRIEPIDLPLGIHALFKSAKTPTYP